VPTTETPSADYAIDVEDRGTSALRRAGLQPGASKSERGDGNRSPLKTGAQANNSDLLRRAIKATIPVIC
jgi:hypothetical protein